MLDANTAAFKQGYFMIVQSRKIRKTLGNNDLNQVVAFSDLSENKGLGGGSVSRAHKTWSRSFLFKDFRKIRQTSTWKERKHF